MGSAAATRFFIHGDASKTKWPPSLSKIISPGHFVFDASPCIKIWGRLPDPPDFLYMVTRQRQNGVSTCQVNLPGQTPKHFSAEKHLSSTSRAPSRAPLGHFPGTLSGTSRAPLGHLPGTSRAPPEHSPALPVVYLALERFSDTGSSSNSSSRHYTLCD